MKFSYRLFCSFVCVKRLRNAYCLFIFYSTSKFTFHFIILIAQILTKKIKMKTTITNLVHKLRIHINFRWYYSYAWYHFSIRNPNEIFTKFNVRSKICKLKFVYYISEHLRRRPMYYIHIMEAERCFRLSFWLRNRCGPSFCFTIWRKL